MKRVFALLLLVCLVCLALAGCGKTNLEESQGYIDDHPLAEKKLYTVSFCLVSDAALDPLVLSGMQAEFNRYTEENYNIHVVFTNKTAAEYAAWLDAKYTDVEAAHVIYVAAEEAYTAASVAEASMPASASDADVLAARNNKIAAQADYNVALKKLDAAVAADVKTNTTAAATALANGDYDAASAAYRTAYKLLEDNTSKSSGNIGSDIREVYPEVLDSQFDIIYIANYEMLSSLVRANRLRDLTAELNSQTYRLIKKQMTEKFFESAKVGGKIFGVPSCRVMAEYKYMRVNVAKANEKNYIFQKELTDYSSTSMLRQAITGDGDNPADYVQRDLIGDYNYRNTLAEDGTWWVYATANEQLPQINQSDLMNGMLAVTSYAYVDNGGTQSTTDDDFCPAVKILYAVSTERALHTILQYGAPGLTYTLKTVNDGNGGRATVVSKINDTGYTYDVDPKYTGNTFSLYPTEEEFLNGTQKGNMSQTTETLITQDVFAMEATPSAEGCTAAPNAPFGKVGETVTFTATPADGYKFVQWYLKGVDGDPDDIRSTTPVYQHVVTKGDGDLNLLALFEALEPENPPEEPEGD